MKEWFGFVLIQCIMSNMMTLLLYPNDGERRDVVRTILSIKDDHRRQIVAIPRTSRFTSFGNGCLTSLSSLNKRYMSWEIKIERILLNNSHILFLTWFFYIQKFCKNSVTKNLPHAKNLMSEWVTRKLPPPPPLPPRNFPLG